MKSVAPAVLAVATILCVSVRPLSALTPVEVDRTPAEQSAEVQELLKHGTFVPDPGEPAGAIKAYFATGEQWHKAMRRLETGLLPGEADFDPYQLAYQALDGRRQAAMRYPTSRHAWQGLGDLLWQQFMRERMASDLKEAIGAYIRAVELTIPQPRGGLAEKHLAGTVRIIAIGLVALSDPARIDAFFGKLRATDLWPYARQAYPVALGLLNDPRADKMFREELVLVAPGETLPDYVSYLWDQGRYGDALRILDLKNGSRLYVPQHAERGALLERLGRLDEAGAEYQLYLAAVSQLSHPWPLFRVSDRYRIAGSPLQQQIKFFPEPDRLPTPRGR